jgi:hypothetical protein
MVSLRRSQSAVLVAAALSLSAVLGAQPVRDHAAASGSATTPWRGDLTRSRLSYEDAMEQLRGHVLAALDHHLAARAAAPVRDRDELADLEAQRRGFLEGGAWPRVARVENLRPRADVLRRGLLAAFDRARSASVRAGATAEAEALDAAARQFATECDLAAFSPNLVQTLPEEQRRIAATPVRWVFDELQQARYRLELVAERVAGNGSLTIGVAPAEGRKVDVQGEAGHATVRVLLSVRGAEVSADLGAGGAPRRTEEELAPGTLVLRARAGEFRLSSVRVKPLAQVRTDPDEADQQETAKATPPPRPAPVEPVRGASAADQERVDPFAVGTTWDGKWNEGSCSIAVVSRGQDSVTFQITRDNGAVFCVDCTTRQLSTRVEAVHHTKVPKGGAKRTLSGVDGGGYVSGDQFSLRFHCRSQQGSKRGSFEATIAGKRRDAQ